LAVIATAQGAIWFEREADRFIDQYYLYDYEAETKLDGIQQSIEREFLE
jgi:hypothetical protein